jgi:hypothetical protein
MQFYITPTDNWTVNAAFLSTVFSVQHRLFSVITFHQQTLRTRRSVTNCCRESKQVKGNTTNTLLKVTKVDSFFVSVQPSITNVISSCRQVVDTCLRPCTLCAQHPTYSALYCSLLLINNCSRHLSICHLWIDALHLVLSTYMQLPSVGNLFDLVLETLQRALVITNTKTFQVVVVLNPFSYMRVCRIWLSTTYTAWDFLRLSHSPKANDTVILLTACNTPHILCSSLLTTILPVYAL